MVRLINSTEGGPSQEGGKKIKVYEFIGQGLNVCYLSSEERLLTALVALRLSVDLELLF